MDAAHTSLPSISPSKEDHSFQRSIFGDRRQLARTHHASLPPAPLSAREMRGDPSNQKLQFHEEAVRGVYKQQAHIFFEEIKEAFTKEATSLRKHTQKALARAGVTPDVDMSDSNPEFMSQLASQMSSLQRQIADLQVTVQHQTQQNTWTNVFPDDSRDCHNHIATLTERVAKQQEDLRSLSRHVKSEFAFAKKAVLTPMWKERALQEIAQGELRTVCTEEVGKALKQLECAVHDDHVEAALLRLCKKESAPWEAVLQKRLERLRSDLTIQILELSHRADEGTVARAVIVERLQVLEESCNQIRTAVVDLTTEGERSHAADIASMSNRMMEVEQDIIARLEEVSSQCEWPRQAFEALKVRLAEDNVQHSLTVSEIASKVTQLESRLDQELSSSRSREMEFQEKLEAGSRATAADAKQTAEDAKVFAREIQSQTQNTMLEMKASMEIARRKADESAKKLATELAKSQAAAEQSAVNLGTQVHNVQQATESALAQASAASNAAAAARAEAEVARGTAVGAVDAVSREVSALAQHVTKLQALDQYCSGAVDRILALEGSMEQLGGCCKALELHMEQLRMSAVTKGCREWTSARAHIAELRRSADQRLQRLAALEHRERWQEFATAFETHGERIELLAMHIEDLLNQAVVRHPMPTINPSDSTRPTSTSPCPQISGWIHGSSKQHLEDEHPFVPNDSCGIPCNTPISAVTKPGGPPTFREQMHSDLLSTACTGSPDPGRESVAESDYKDGSPEEALAQLNEMKGRDINDEAVCAHFQLCATSDSDLGAEVILLGGDRPSSVASISRLSVSSFE